MPSSPVILARVSSSVPGETPGAPSFAEAPIQQGAFILTKITMPLQDVIGPVLSGLTHYHVASATVVNGVGAMDGKTGPEIIASGVWHKVVAVTQADAGLTKEELVPVLAPTGGDQDIAIWVDDDPS